MEKKKTKPLRGVSLSGLRHPDIDATTGFKVEKDQILTVLAQELAMELYGDELLEKAAKEIEFLDTPELSKVLTAAMKWPGLTLLEIVRKAVSVKEQRLQEAEVD